MLGFSIVREVEKKAMSDVMQELSLVSEENRTLTEIISNGINEYAGEIIADLTKKINELEEMIPADKKDILRQLMNAQSEVSSLRERLEQICPGSGGLSSGNLMQSVQEGTLVPEGSAKCFLEGVKEDAKEK